MKRTIAPAVIVLGMILPVLAAGPAEPEAAKKAILETTTSYAAAFNKHDAKALAAHWSKTGIHVDPQTGHRTVGREAIQRVFAQMFQEGEVRDLTLNVDSVRLVTADVAVVEGTAAVALAHGESSDSTFCAVLVRQDGKWLVDSTYETDLPSPPTPYDHLKELEWMVGTWKDESGDTIVKTVCKWTPNRSFLTRSYNVSVGGKVKHQGTQVIGWDPERECIRTWIFDSDGGFGDGVWSRDGDRWTAKLRGVLPDGRKGSATQVITRLSNDAMSVQMVGREIDGELLPNQEPIKVVRVADDQ